MKTIKTILSAALTLLLIASMMNFTTSENGRDIMLKVENREDGTKRSSDMKIELINKRGSKRVRSIKSYSIDIGKDKKSIMFFTAPSDVKNTGFLTWDYHDIKKDDDRWLYLPAMKKTRRISGSSAKKDYFMGTDFTYDDMGGNRNVDEDKHKLIKEETMEGKACWKIESIPVDPKDMYSKKISWIRKDCLYPVKVEYYDRMGQALKTLTISDIKKIDGIWTAHKMHMKNHQKVHETILTFSNTNYSVDLKESDFTVANLERGSI